METKERIKSILTCIKEKIKDDLDSDSLVSDGFLDSFDIISLISELEEAFDVEIDPDDVMSENFESIDAIAALVEKCKAE